MQELRVDIVAFEHALHHFDFVELFAGDEALLAVDVLVGGAHVAEDRHLGRHFAFDGAAAREEGFYLGAVLVQVPVLEVLYPVHIEGGRMVQVTHKRKRCRTLSN